MVALPRSTCAFVEQCLALTGVLTGCERQLRCLRALGSVSRFITVDWTEWGLPGDMAAWARV